MTVSVGQSKAELRETLRERQRKAVAALGPGERALILLRPPNALLELVPEGAAIGLYHASPREVPANRLARWFAEAGHTVALPRFATRDAAMEFALHSDPFGESDLAAGPFGMMQPGSDADAVVPECLFVPLLGFTARGDRIGRGAGHYDRWLAANPQTMAIGLAWDTQEVEALPVEPHDVAMHAILTPTRLIGPFA